MKNLFIIFLNVFCLSAWAQPNLMVEEYAAGFTRPVNIANAGDERLFIVEQPGRIKIIDSNGPYSSISRHHRKIGYIS